MIKKLLDDWRVGGSGSLTNKAINRVNAAPESMHTPATCYDDPEEGGTMSGHGHQDFAHVAGTRLAYEVVGSGPCLVLIHGFTLDSRMWDDQIDVFAQHYQVVRYDLRGFGRSDLPDTRSYTPSADLKALLEYLGIGKAAIIGLSLGGGVALDFALSYPELTRSLILVSAMVEGWAWSPACDAEVVPVWTAGRDLGVAVAKERWLAHPLFLPALQQPEVARRLSRMVDDYSGWHWQNDDPRQRLQPPAMQRLGSITAPTLIILGEHDVPDFQAMAATFERDIPGSRKVTMSGVGHMANMEDPKQFNALVRQFLDDQ
jgi:pimeloyl-ACP methyl ester carboxylesterase